MKAIELKDLIYLEEENAIPTKEDINKLIEIVKENQSQGIILLEYFTNISKELSNEIQTYFIKQMEDNIEVTGNNRYVFNMEKQQANDFTNHKLKENNTLIGSKQINNPK